MKTELLDYNLPPELIAQEPAAVRSCSRLLVMDLASGKITDSRFRLIGRFVSKGDCLVLNDTRVLPARFFGRRRTGGRIEGLFLGEERPGLWKVMLKGLGKLRIDETVLLEGSSKGSCTEVEATLMAKTADGICSLGLADVRPAPKILDDIGSPPLPPYIRRTGGQPVVCRDRRRYQTIYARRPGAVAAPTAGLHFTRGLLAKLADSGVAAAFVTLHTGPATFKPITAKTLENHHVTSEFYSVSGQAAATINAARKSGGRIVAVGTTSVRTLETAWRNGAISPCSGMTDLFIRPPYAFRAVDALVTNFHLPRSTLLALVTAFAGLERVLSAYRHAIEKGYRFYSYGDAMLVT